MKKIICMIVFGVLFSGVSLALAETFWQKIGDDTGWQIRIGSEYNFVPGCISRFTRHFHAHLRNHITNDEKFNVHVAFWPNGDEFCMGIYDSVRARFDATYKGDCKCSLDPTDPMFDMSEVDKKIASEARDALMRASIGVGAASAFGAYVAGSFGEFGILLVL